MRNLAESVDFDILLWLNILLSWPAPGLLAWCHSQMTWAGDNVAVNNIFVFIILFFLDSFRHMDSIDHFHHDDLILFYLGHIVEEF